MSFDFSETFLFSVPGCPAFSYVAQASLHHVLILPQLPDAVITALNFCLLASSNL